MLKFVFDSDFNKAKKKESVASDSDIGEKVVEDKALKRYVRNEELHVVASRELDELCPRPLPNEQYRIVTEKSFNAYALIKSLLEEGHIDDLYIAIYRINEPTVNALIGLLEDGRIKHATFIISNFFAATKRPERWAQQLASYCQSHPEVTSFCYLHNHCKVVCARQHDDYFVFEGSGNMSDNARIEQYTYENNKLVYEFHTSWMKRLAHG